VTTSLAAELAGRSNPFPGLRPFEPDEDYLFFGREKQLDELLRRLRGNRFLAILGTSGCGKSSLVRSGLIPSLYGGAMTRAGSSWRVAVQRPGEDPIGNLAAALNAPEVLAERGQADELSRSFLEANLRASNRGLIECVAQSRLGQRPNLLVVVDQFEELFRFKQTTSRGDALAFSKLLLTAVRHPESRIYVCLTMRSDFVGNCNEFTGLPEAVNEGLYLVPRMQRDELRAAISGPVAVGGGTIAPRLVTRLLNDVGDDPDQLPVLQHALMRTWDLWREDHAAGEPLDLRHYQAIGTMREALSLHCEEAYGVLDAAGQRIAEVMFKALTDRGTDGRGIRRPVALAEICEVADAAEAAVVPVVDCFRAPGRSFLMPPAGVALHGGSTIDLSHESLMRGWQRLAAWAEDEARSAHFYLGVARAAERHAAGTSALWRDPELQLALSWRETERPTAAWARRYDPGFERAMRFLEASAAERDATVAEREERRRRELRRARRLALVLGSAALVTLALGSLAFSQKNRAETALRDVRAQKRIADEQRSRAETHQREALRQASLADRQSQIARRERANALGQERMAEEQKRLAEVQRQRAQTEELLAKAKAAEAVAARQEAEGRRGEAIQQRERADQLRTLAQTSEREARRLGLLSWARAAALQVLHPQREWGNELPALMAVQAFKVNRDNGGQPDDPELVTALRVALGRLSPDPVLRGHGDAVRAIEVAPDGWQVFSGSEDGKVRRFDLRRPEAPATVLGSFSGGVRALASSASGELLAAGSAAGELSVWNLREPGQAPRQLGARRAAAGEGSGPAPGPTPAPAIVSSLAFQPAGRWLASGASDGGVRLWDLDHPEAALRLDTGGKRVLALAWSPDGDTLAAGLDQKGGALLWNPRQGAGGARAACEDKDVRALAFGRDGKALFCGTAQGDVVLGYAAGARRSAGEVTVLPGPVAAINALRISPDGESLATAGGDGSVRLWSVRRPATGPVVLPGHESWVWAVAFSPDGAKLLSGGEDRTIHVWSPRSDVLAEKICRQVRRDLTRDERLKVLPAELRSEQAPTCPTGA
jgi:energy-coupling factor transporter ATP-binding protein EcfA2